jgi:hypothetical protein
MLWCPAPRNWSLEVIATVLPGSFLVLFGYVALQNRY